MSADNLTYTFNQTPLVTNDVIEGTAQLTSEGFLEVTDLIEAMHKEIFTLSFLENTPKFVDTIYEHTTGRIYKIIKLIMELSGNATKNSLRFVNLYLPLHIGHKPLSKNLNILVSALNGVMGDHLVNLDNPLALPMLLHNGKAKLADLHNLQGNITILLHGLCMSQYCWLLNNKHSLGYKLQQAIPNSTVLYLQYNTGRRISKNGAMLSALLKQIIADNPKVSSINLIGHSMGGLVIRSAMFYGERDEEIWLNKVKNYVAICSPHNGAMLERLGYNVQQNLAKLPVAGNLARLGHLRSAGILDLRHANLRHKDWEHQENRIGNLEDNRHVTPLPETVNSYLIGASIDKKNTDTIFEGWIGDGVIKLSTAMGEHEDEKYNLNVPHQNKAIFYKIDHNKILKLDAMHQQVIEWLMKSY